MKNIKIVEFRNILNHKTIKQYQFVSSFGQIRAENFQNPLSL